MISNFEVGLSIHNPNFDFLEAQLHTIALQRQVDVLLLVRFDGCDSAVISRSLELLKQENLKYNIIVGERIGACASFLNIIEHSSGARNFAFCDQDDIWLPDKLHISSKLLNQDLPALGIVNFVSIGKENGIISDSKLAKKLKSKQIFPTPKNALFENLYPGNTMALNPAGLRTIKENLPAAEKIVMHDAWVYLVMSACGNIKVSKEISVLYRQHEGNLIGLKSGRFNNRIRRFLFEREDKRLSMASEFVRLFPNNSFTPTVHKFLKIQESGFLKRINLVRSIQIVRNKKLDKFMLCAALILFGKQKFRK